MERTKIDYIIIGQGLAGTWLSHELLKRNYSVVVINQPGQNTSSKKAAGLYNPITGRKMIKTWRANALFSVLHRKYKELEQLLNARFIHPYPIYRPFRTVEDQNDWQGRFDPNDFTNFIESHSNSSKEISHINDPYGGITIRNSGYVDLPTMIEAYKNYLLNKGIYHEEVFSDSEVEMFDDKVIYQDWEAKNLIFCGGTFTSRYWKDLPFRPVRGEIMDIECDLETNLVINQGVFIIPKNGFYTVGATYDHKVLTFEPQATGINELERRLGKLFTGKYTIIDQRAGVRPATHDRRPYIGFHKKFRTLSIFNGFGSKGVSLSPYFAEHFANVLAGRDALDNEINVERVY